MKSTFRILALGAGVFALVLCMGSKEEETAKADASKPAPETPAKIDAAVAAKQVSQTPPPIVAGAADTVPGTNAAPATNIAGLLFSTNLTAEPMLPASLKLSPPLGDVVKLIQAGVSEEVLMAFISGAADPFDASSDAIIYLHDLGVSSNVITALIQHDATPEMQAKKQVASAVKPLPPGVALHSPATNIYHPKEPVAPTQNPPEPEPVNPPASVSDAAVWAPPAAPVAAEEPAAGYDAAVTTVSYNYWYSNLAPYGSWVDVGGYGPCWRPTVAVCNSAWRPYGDCGRWLWSNSGWYWYSDYTWGWGPFHYGRWACPSGVGWVWVPGNTWGPGWVSWRYTPTYCGWAPLPPAACYYPHTGFYYNTASVGIGCEFGLGASAYVFLPVNRFCDRRPYNYYVNGGHAQTIYNSSTVVNNYVVGNNNTVINNGVGVDRIAQATRGDVRRVALKDSTSIRDLGPRREQLSPDGATLAVHRPDSVTINRLAAIAGAPRPVPATALTNPRTGRTRGSVPGSATVAGPSDSTRDAAQAGTDLMRPVGSGLTVASLDNDSSIGRGLDPRGGQGRLSAPGQTRSRSQLPSAGLGAPGADRFAGSALSRRDMVSRPTPLQQSSATSSGTSETGKDKSTVSPIIMRNPNPNRSGANRPVTYPFAPATDNSSATKPAPAVPRSQTHPNNSAPSTPRSSYVPGPPRGSYGGPSIPAPTPAPSYSRPQPSYSAPAPSRVESSSHSVGAPSPGGGGHSAPASSGGGHSNSRGSDSGSASPGSFGPVGRGR